MAEGAEDRLDAPDPDTDLVERARGGDGAAFEGLVTTHQRRVFNTAYRVLGDYEEALDIAQDAFVQAYRSLSGFRGEARFSTWLLTITVNLCRNRIKYWKRRSRNRTSSLDCPIATGDSEVMPQLPDPSPSVLEHLSGRETEEIIREEMMGLDEEYRTVLVLRELQEMSYQEIGEILSLAEGTVKSRLHRGRTELRDRLRLRLAPAAGAPLGSGAEEEPSQGKER